jgi:hypothetical protein
VLGVTHAGELLLFDAQDDEFKPTERVKVWEDETGLRAHSAFVGTQMCLRGHDGEFLCVELKP